MLLDASVSFQTYVEDSEVCCNPIEVTVRCEDQEVMEFDAQSLGQ